MVSSVAHLHFYLVWQTRLIASLLLFALLRVAAVTPAVNWSRLRCGKRVVVAGREMIE